MLLPISLFLARARQSLVFLQFAVGSLQNSGGLGPWAGSPPGSYAGPERTAIFGDFLGKRIGPLTSHFRWVMPTDRARPKSHSPPSSPISLLPGSYVLPPRPEARDKTSCLALSKEAEALLGKSRRGGIFSTWGPLLAGAGAARGGGGGCPAPPSQGWRGKVSMETAALASPEIWGKTD